MVGRANAHRSKGIKAERATFLDLPVGRTANYDPISVNITSSSGFVLRRVFYTVPSRQLEEIEHRTTRVRRPQSNVFVERLHRTLLDKHFRVMGPKKFYYGIEAMQTDPDDYPVRYNTERPHQGRGMKGRTLADIFFRCLPKPKTPKEQKIKRAAKTNPCRERQLSGEYPICPHEN